MAVAATPTRTDLQLNPSLLILDADPRRSAAKRIAFVDEPARDDGRNGERRRRETLRVRQAKAGIDNDAEGVRCEHAIGSHARTVVTPIRRVDHVAIAVRDTDAALAYFSDHLGLRVVSRENVEEANVSLTYLDAGSILIQLVQPLDGPSPIRQALDERGEGVHHLCFSVDDVPAAAAELASGLGDEEVRVGRGRGRVSAFVPGAVRHGVRLECTAFDRAADVEQNAGWLDPSSAGVAEN